MCPDPSAQLKLIGGRARDRPGIAQSVLSQLIRVLRQEELRLVDDEVVDPGARAPSAGI